ncbi:unnamed protein product [Polarella glacialis]|uniref:Pentacotripeptide-repeat region of PRORP domain-containing protein n=1 Tax=Polarella glacialis TaxID=89957 RepID=A0A813J3Y0_POLGL|nr:unnamed protein product [Polarella glacialis]
MQAMQAQPDIVSYNSVLKACSRAGLADKAWEWLQAMGQASLQPTVVSYTSAMNACGRAKPANPELARHIFEEMVAAGVELDRVALRSVSRLLGQGYVAQALCSRPADVTVPERVAGHVQKPR